MRISFVHVLIGFVVALAGAGCGGGAATDAGTPDAGPPRDGACEGCGALEFDLEVVGQPGQPAAPVVDDASVPWVWGPQGGSMVQPVLIFDGARVPAGTDVVVTVRHGADPAAPERFARVMDFLETTFPVRLTTDPTGRVVAGPLNDQLAWTSIDGARFVYTVEVTAVGFGTARREAVVELGTMSVPASCGGFVLEGMGCMYRSIPGIVTVAPFEPAPPGEASCVDGVRVTLAFTTLDPEARACLESQPLWGGGSLPFVQTFYVSAGYHPPRGCLEAAGIVEGAALPARLMVEEVGTCTPLSLRLYADTSACESMCMAPMGG